MLAALAAGWTAICIKLSGFQVEARSIRRSFNNGVPREVTPAEFDAYTSAVYGHLGEENKRDSEQDGSFLQIFGSSKTLRKLKKTYKKLKKAYMKTHKKKQFKVFQLETMIAALEKVVGPTT